MKTTQEKNPHILLKKIATKILLSEGFSFKEIFYEYHIHIGKRRWWKIDVVGISKHKKIFIECGSIQRKSKINKILNYCDKFIYIPYLNKCFGKPYQIIELMSNNKEFSIKEE